MKLNAKQRRQLDTVKVRAKQVYTTGKKVYSVGRKVKLSEVG